MEFLKKILSKETYEKVIEECKGKGKDGADYTVLPNDGTYIPKTKFDEVNTAKANLEKERDDYKKELDDIKNSDEDTEKLKEKITTLTNTIEENKKQADKDMQELRLNSALKLDFIEEAQDVDLVCSLIDKSKLTMDEKGEKIVMGLQEQKENLKKTKPFLFKDVDPDKNLEGDNPPGNGGDGKVKTDEVMSLEDAVADALNI